MAKGDHLFCSQGAYQHHAIDLGNGNVIQYGGADFSSLSVEIVSYERLSMHGQVYVADSQAEFSPDEIVGRAESRIGENNYCLFTNNCEHFVNWCRMGVAESRQVNRVVERTTAAGTKLATKTSARIAQRLGLRWLLKRLPSSSMPLLVAADFAQLGAEVAAANRGSQPHQAERIGQAVGLGASIGIGSVIGGPFGAAAGAGIWALGEAAGKLTTTRRKPG